MYPKLFLHILVLNIFLIYLYNTIISFFAFIKKNNSVLNIKDNTKFLILIPCHNEEDVIYNTIKHIYLSDYEKQNFTIVPILDNCTDNTFNEVNKFISNYPSVNCIPISVKGGTKPKALNAATKHLKSTNQWENYDSIVVIDADNVVDKNMLRIYNSLHFKGEKILQCRILSHNDKTTVAKGFTSSFNHITYGFQISRNNIGLSASLCGTGFSINRQVWDDVGFENCSSLAEDLEFSILSIIKGYKVKFVKESYVLNQNLDEFIPSITQRLRWCRGHAQVMVNCLPKIIVSFIRKPRFQLIDSLLFLSTPSRTLLYFLANLLAITFKSYIIPLWIIVALATYNLLFMIYCNNFKVKYIIPHFCYAVSMQIIIVFGLLTYNKKNWTKTVHKKIT